MELGKFSLSLAVQDLQVSKAFYRKLGFEVEGPDPSWTEEMRAGFDERWVMLKNGSTRIGLFEKMFDKNLLTFHPPDVRAVQEALDAQGVELVQRAEPGEGPAHCVLIDPDGNPVLFDQL